VTHALRVFDAAKGAFAGAGEQFGDPVSEARAEMKRTTPRKPSTKSPR
jgi:hypothetical protein